MRIEPLKVRAVTAAFDRTRVDAVAGGEDADRDHHDQEDDCCHALIVPEQGL